MIDSILNSGVSSGVVDHLGWVLLHSVWQFALIALICAVTMAVAGPRTSATRYATYGGMLLLMGLLPLATWIATGSGPELSQPNVSAVVVGESDSLTANEATDIVALTPAATIDDVSSVDLATDTASAQTPASTIPPLTPTVHNESAGLADIPFRAVIAPWLNEIVGVWCLGVAVFSLRPVVGWWMVQRLKSVGVAKVSEDVAAVASRLKEQLGLHCSVRVLQSTLVNSPIVVGCFRSVILLPTSLLTALPASQLEFILAHELAHVRRFDYLINVLQTGMETLFFYHPAVWWMSRRMRIERENCCDDVVVGALGGRVQYGRALLAIEEHRSATAALALGASDGSLLSRVGRILSADDAAPLKPSPFGVIALAMACLLVATTGVFLMRTVQADESADEGWGEVSHGLQCRVVAIDASRTDDEESDFDTFADVLLQVELRNVSDEALQLAGLPRAGVANESLPHWFRLDVRCEDGSPLPRTHREFFEPWQLAHGDDLTELAPGETKRVTLRPAQWRSPMDYELPAGRFRVAVTFRGPDETLIRDLETHGETHRLVSASRNQVRSNEFALNIAEDIHRTPRLVWGENTNGLKAALEIRAYNKENPDPTSLPGIPAGTGLQAVVHLKNVSANPISVVSETARQGDQLSVTNEKGEPIEIRDAFFSGWPIDVVWTVQPGETAQLKLLTPRLRTDLAPGRYDVTCKVRFDSRVSTDGDGNRTFPRADDYFSNIKTGVAVFFIAAEDQEGLEPESAGVERDPGGGEFPGTSDTGASAGPGPLNSVNGSDDELDKDAPFRLPDHWIIEDLLWVKNDTELITVARQGGVDVRRWDVANRKLLSEIKLQSDVHGRPIRQGSLQLSPDGLRIFGVTDIEYSKRIAGTNEARFVFVWDTRNGKLLNKLPIPQKGWAYNTVGCLDCSADGSIVVAGLSTDFDKMGHGFYSGHGIAWDCESRKVLSRFEIEKSSDVSCVSVTPDGKWFATCTRGHRIGVWETSTGNQLQDFTQYAFNWSSPDPKIIKNNVVRGVAFRPDGRQLAIAGTFGVRLVDVETGQLTASIDVPYRYGSPEITYTADGQQLARSGVRATEDSPSAVAVYSSESGEWLTDLIHGSDCVAFAKSGQRIAIADSDFYEAVSVWPIEPGKKLGPLPEPKGRPRINRVEENTHTTGDTAESFVRRWQPVWGEPVNGIQYGVAFTSEQSATDGTPRHTTQFDEESRMTMAAFLKNASDRPIQIDCRPDMFGNLPVVRSTGGTVVGLGKQKLIGSPSHYRDVLEPGEHFGPLYLQVAVGSNPRPNRQYWTPFWPNPVHGEYSVAHKVTVLTRPPQAKPDVEKPDWTSGEVTSGSLNFRIGDETVASGDSGGNSEGSN